MISVKVRSIWVTRSMSITAPSCRHWLTLKRKRDSLNQAILFHCCEIECWGSSVHFRCIWLQIWFNVLNVCGFTDTYATHDVLVFYNLVSTSFFSNLCTWTRWHNHCSLCAQYNKWALAAADHVSWLFFLEALWYFWTPTDLVDCTKAVSEILWLTCKSIII